jgi:hypothetical protein
MLKLEQSDRVSVAFGRKVNVGNYESVDFHFSYSTDVRHDETADMALHRARAFVTSKLNVELKTIRGKKTEDEKKGEQA